MSRTKHHGYSYHQLLTLLVIGVGAIITTALCEQCIQFSSGLFHYNLFLLLKHGYDNQHKGRKKLSLWNPQLQVKGIEDALRR